MTSPPPEEPAPHGVVRLLNTADGRALCLAGVVDAQVVDQFLGRYGREPARIEVIDAGSVTFLSPPALSLVLDHLDAAARDGRVVAVRPSPPLSRGLAAAGRTTPP